MSWRVFLTDSSQPDLDALTSADRAAVTEELFAWSQTVRPSRPLPLVYEDKEPTG